MNMGQGNLLDSQLQLKERIVDMAFAQLHLVYQFVPIPGPRSCAHGHSQLNHLSVRLLQYAIHEAAFENPPKTSAGAEYNGADSSGCSSLHAHCYIASFTSPYRFQIPIGLYVVICRNDPTRLSL